MAATTGANTMTDITQPVDLSTLEQGDTVVFRDGKQANVAHVNKRNYDVVLHLGFRNGTVSKIRYSFFGQTMYYNENYTIDRIIKNPKRWTDEDMKLAFEYGLKRNGAVIHHEAMFSWVRQHNGSENEAV